MHIYARERKDAEALTNMSVCIDLLKKKDCIYPDVDHIW